MQTITPTSDPDSRPWRMYVFRALSSFNMASIWRFKHKRHKSPEENCAMSRVHTPFWNSFLLLFISAKAGCIVENPVCYADTSARILGSDDVALGPITPEYCAQLCSTGHFRLAGTENGEECYCGDFLKTDKPTRSQSCDSECSGDSSSRVFVFLDCPEDIRLSAIKH